MVPQTALILPAFNVEAYVSDAIHSILQDDEPCLILVVDDGSTDGTSACVQRLIKATNGNSHHRIVLTRTENNGVSHARNTALEQMPDGIAYVAFLDADDLSISPRLAQQRTLLDADPDVDVVYGRLQKFLDSPLKNDRPQQEVIQPPERTIHLGVALFRRSVIDELGRFDTTLLQAEDTDYLFRLAESGFTVFRDPTVRMYYRDREGSLTKDEAFARRAFLRATLMSAKRRARHQAKECAQAVPLNAAFMLDENEQET